MTAALRVNTFAGVRSERGSAAAEFAVVLPAVLLVLALCLGAVTSTAQYTRLVDAAADSARSLGRGDASTSDAVKRVDPAAAVDHSVEGELVCVRVDAQLHPVPMLSVPVTVRSCALGGGR